MLIIEKKPKSICAEAFRTLRTNIQYSSFDKDIKTILVTSSAPNEGKSTTCSNLALSMAEAGKSVLLLDCDFRKPSIHRKFGISNRMGLTNFLLGEVTFEQTATLYKNKLFIMTSGTIPPNPSEMLSSNKLKIFIDKMGEQFDYIVIDSPPVMAVTDAQILSTIADGVLLVVASGQTDKNLVQKAKKALEKVKANILGAVINKVKNESGKGYGYYYYYYGEDDKSKRKKRKYKEKTLNEKDLKAKDLRGA